MNADPPGDGPGEQGLEQLLGLLTSGPTPDELGGESAAMSMFRATIRPSAADGRLSAADKGPPAADGRPPAAEPRAPRRQPRRFSPRARLAVIAAAVAITGGFAMAAYAQALPAPVQHVAYRLLGFVGVPDDSNAAPSPPGTPHRGGGSPTAGHSTSPGHAVSSSPASSASPSASSSPSPHPSGGHHSRSPRPHGSSPPPAAGRGRLVLTAAQQRIAAGASDDLTASLTRHGHGIAGITLTLAEHSAGQPGWHPDGHATTDQAGRATLTVSDVRTNVRFVLIGPHNIRSHPVKVIVIPAVSASFAHGPGGRSGVVTATSPLAAPGDTVVLEVRTTGHWVIRKVRRLSASRQASFALRRHARKRDVRVVLLATTAHGRSVSGRVTVPPF